MMQKRIILSRRGTDELFVDGLPPSRVLGLIPGAVSPFGLLNDMEKKALFYLDTAFRENPGLIVIHPNDNTWMKTRI